MKDWFNSQPKSSESIMGSDNENTMFNSLNYYAFHLNSQLARFGLSITVSHDQPAPGLMKDFQSFVSNHIEPTDFEIWLPQNPNRNTGKTLELGGSEYIVPSKSGAELIWALSGSYQGTPAYDLPDGFFDWAKKHFREPPLPAEIIHALEYRPSCESKEAWEQWFEDTFGKLGKKTTDKVKDYLLSTSIDFTIELNGLGNSRKPFLSIEQDGIGSGFISEGTYRSIPSLRSSKYNWRREWKMLVKMWYHRQMDLPLFITPLFTSSSVGVNNRFVFPYIGFIVSRALADFLYKNMDSINMQQKKNQQNEFIQPLLLDEETIKRICLPCSPHLEEFRANMSHFNYNWYAKSLDLPVEHILEISTQTDGHPQFPNGLVGSDYISRRLSEEEFIQVFGVDFWKLHTLVIEHPEHGEIKENLLEFPLDFSQPIRYGDEFANGYLAFRLNTLHRMQYTVVDYIPNTKIVENSSKRPRVVFDNNPTESEHSLNSNYHEFGDEQSDGAD